MAMRSLLTVAGILLVCCAACAPDSGPGSGSVLDPAAAAAAPHIVFVTGDHEYGSERTIPLLAAELERNYGMRATVLQAFPDEYAEENIPGLEALREADLAVFYLRFRRLPEEQLSFIQEYLDSGKPLMGFRTTTHAFRYEPRDPRERWNDFGADVLGAPWIEHYGHLSSTDIRTEEVAAGHPILTGVDPEFRLRSWLYIVRPDYPPVDATVLLTGTSVGPSDWEIREDQPVAWTLSGTGGRRVFTTTLGHPEDFRVEAFQRLVLNAVHWGLGADVPESWAGPMSIEVPYEKPFELGNGARVVLLGNGYFEREAASSYLETVLTSRYHGRGVTFRNLGWSGDTVNVQMRPLNFGGLGENVAAQEPSLVFVAYGMNESFDGDAGLEPFWEGYEDLLNMLQDGVGARPLLVSPTRHDEAASPAGNVTDLNEGLSRYAEAVERIARRRDLRFVDLFEPLAGGDAAALDVTTNGRHLTELGYWLAALRTERELGLDAPDWLVEVNAVEQTFTTSGTTVSQYQSDTDGLRFVALDARLPLPPPPADASGAEDRLTATAELLRDLAARVSPPRHLVAAGLEPGQYALRVDGELVTSAASAQWERGVVIAAGPQFDQVEELRQTIVDKNRFFFFRWRAHNAEYIFGRRSRSSGEADGEGNSGNPQFVDEMARFEAMIREHEPTIDRLATPVSHEYSLTRVNENGR